MPSTSCCPRLRDARAGCCRRAPATCTCSSRAARSSSSGHRLRRARRHAATLGLAELGPELARGGRASRIAVPLVAGDELLGLLVAEQSSAVDIARAVASQIAVGIKKIQLIERLTEKNLIQDFFEALAAGRGGGLVLEGGQRGSAATSTDRTRARCRAGRRRPGTSPAGLLPGSLFDRREDSLRGLLRLPAGGGERAATEIVRRAHADCAGPLAIGLSSVVRGPRELRRRLRGGTAGALRHDRARSARRRSSRSRSSGPTSTSCGSPPTGACATPRSRRSRASPTTTATAVRHSCRRSRSSSSVAGASAPHPTRSISTQTPCGSACAGSLTLSGIDLRRDDWLMIEIAVKLVQLRLVLAAR